MMNPERMNSKYLSTNCKYLPKRFSTSRSTPDPDRKVNNALNCAVPLARGDFVTGTSSIINPRSCLVLGSLTLWNQ